MDDERWALLHEHYVSTAVDCIEDLGYEVSEPPSLEVYLAQSAEARWDPYGDVEQAFVEDAVENNRWESFNDLYDACPPEPPGW